MVLLETEAISNRTIDNEGVWPLPSCAIIRQYCSVQIYHGRRGVLFDVIPHSSQICDLYVQLG